MFAVTQGPSTIEPQDMVFVSINFAYIVVFVTVLQYNLSLLFTHYNCSGGRSIQILYLSKSTNTAM